jgi:hypothetical protein
MTVPLEPPADPPPAPPAPLSRLRPRLCCSPDRLKEAAWLPPLRVSGALAEGLSAGMSLRSQGSLVRKEVAGGLLVVPMLLVRVAGDEEAMPLLRSPGPGKSTEEGVVGLLMSMPALCSTLLTPWLKRAEMPSDRSRPLWPPPPPAPPLEADAPPPPTVSVTEVPEPLPVPLPPELPL